VALHVAACYGHCAVIDALLAAGAAPTVYDMHGTSGSLWPLTVGLKESLLLILK